MPIHSTAIVDPKAKIHPSCKIGPYCVVGPDVELGKGCRLMSHVVMEGPTKIGVNNGFFPFSSIGLAPQDITYAGERTRLEIGDHNQIGSHIIMANAATLGGHVIVEDWASVGALCPVHHFVRIGTHSIIGGGTTVTRDVLPFSKTSAERGTHAYGLNAIGLERRGFSKDRIKKLHHAYRLLLASKLNTSQAVEKMKAEADRGEDVDLLIRFIEASERGVIK